MKKHRLEILLVAVCFLLGGFAGGVHQASAAPAFTSKSFKGTFALDVTGSYRSGSQSLTMVGTGILSASGDGNLEATVTTMDASITCNVTLSGTYSVQSNGSGTGALTVASSAPSNGICDKFTGQQASFAFVLIGKHPADKIKLSLTTSLFTLLGIGEAQK